MIGGKLLEGRSQRERVMLLGLGALAVLLLAFLLLKVLGGGGGDEALDTPLPPVVSRSPSPTPTGTATRPPLPVTDAAFGRDPFQPLVSDAPPGGGGTPTPSPGPNGGSSTSRRVTLVDIFNSGGERRATVSVDGTEFTVAEGETFDTSFRLQSLTARCGTFIFGDERFTLCLGQQVNK